MPQSLLNQLNPWMLQLFSIFLAGCLLAALCARASHRLLQTLPDDTPEKPELLRASGSLWFLWWPPVAIGLFYTLVVWALAPLSGFVVLALALLMPPVVLMLRGRTAYLDAPFAAVEVVAARLARRAPDPQRWLAIHRRQVERRRKLAVLPHIMLVLMIALAVLGAFGYVSIDRVLAVRVHSMAVAEKVQQQMGPSAGTIYSRTPPCVKQPTLIIVPPPKVSLDQEAALQLQAEGLLHQLDPRHHWEVGVYTDKRLLPPSPAAAAGGLQ